MLQKIGFIGLGTVGRHMAANLTKGSYELTVFDTELAVVQELAALGAKPASSALEAAKGRDLVIAIVPEGDELGPLFFGKEGILAGIDSGTILADMGSHSLETTMKLAEECARKKVPYLDAPVWGSKDHAVNGLMTIITAGDKALAGRYDYHHRRRQSAGWQMPRAVFIFWTQYDPCRQNRGCHQDEIHRQPCAG